MGALQLALLTLRQIALVTAFFLTFLGLGEPLRRALRLPPAPLPERCFFSACAGLGLALLWAGALGALGLLRPALLLLLPLLALPGLAALRGQVAAAALRPLLVMALLLLPLLLLTLYPSRGWDDTSYHLPLARHFLDHQRLAAAPALRYPVFPANGELLFALGLVVAPAGSPATAMISAQGLCWLCLWLLSVGCYAMAPRAGLLAVALLCANRVLVVLAGRCYIDIVLCLFLGGAAFALARGLRQGAGRGFLVLAALLLGVAVGTKYTALLFALCCGAALLASPRRRALPLLMVLVALLGGGFYLRSLLYTGNPVWPFLRGVFGASALWNSNDYLGQFLDLGQNGPRKTLLGVLTLPWYLATRQEMGAGPLEVHPLLLLGLLAALWRRRGLGALGLLALLYGLCWFLSFNHIRYLTPVLSVLAVLAASGWLALVDRLRPRWRRLALVALLTGLVAPTLVMALWPFFALGAPPATAAQRDEFLARRSTAYRAVREAAALPGITYSLLAEDSLFHGEGKLIGDAFGRARYGDVLALLAQPEALAQHLRRLGAQHLLVHKARLGIPFTPGPSLRLVYEDPGAALYQLRSPGEDPP